MSTPRTRENRLPRPRIRCGDQVGRESYPLTCPRCGWPCTHLMHVYAWETPWNEHGGLCTECISDACATFDSQGWPPNPEDRAGSQGEEEEPAEQLQAFDPGEALPKDLLPKGRSKAGAPKKRPRRGVT